MLSERIMSESFDDHIGEKLTVTKRYWHWVFPLLRDIHMLYHWYRVPIFHNYGKRALFIYKYSKRNFIYIYIYTRRNTRRWLGSVRAFKNCTLFYESYCFNIIECFGAEYPQVLIARLWPKNYNIDQNTIEFYTCLS